MKKNLLTSLLSLVAAFSCAVGFSACQSENASNTSTNSGEQSVNSEVQSDALDNENDDSSSIQPQKGQIPVYQGMSITSAATPAVKTLQNKSIMRTPGNTNNNGNHNGWYKGDHEDKDEEVDKEKPYPDNNDDENIENEIESTLEIVGADKDVYYATASEDIYIKIHLSNPDNYEILSFTLNGKKYSSYMFEEGSDMETLILKYNVGENSGIHEYTIDAIKYIDGTDIKDVIMDGEKTVVAGIKTANQVTAAISNLTVQTNSFSFDVNVKDKDTLLEYSEGSLKAVLYNGDIIVETQDLNIGENSVTFDGLATNGLYQYAVVGYYDDLSGTGFGMNVLYKDALYTKSVVLFSDIVVGQEDIQFNFLWNENIQNKNLTALTLYQGEEKTSLSTTATKVEDLLSNTEYTLIAEYINLGKTESIRLDFATAMKSTPVMEIVSPTKTQTSVGFTINETDTDNVGALTKIELIHANGTVVADSLDVREFTGLLSNNTYTVKVTYTYDLNDGAGSQEIVKTLDVKTDAKATPSITLAETSVTQTSFGFAFIETDTDNIGAVTKIELIHGEDTTAIEDLTTREFTGLLSNTPYTVKVTYAYDLNDGFGAQEIVKTLDIKTEAKAMPAVSLMQTSVTQTSVGFAIEETDTDNVGEVIKIELVYGDKVVEADDLNVREFADLPSDNLYVVKVTYTYDLNDGVGTQTMVEMLNVTTGAKIKPTVTLAEGMITQTSVGFAINETDVDNIGEVTKIELVHANGTVVAGSLDVREFTGLLSNNPYTVKVTYAYDLNDGFGAQEIVKTLDIKTEAKATPAVSLIQTSVTQTSIGFAIDKTDADNVGVVTNIELIHSDDIVVADNLDAREFTGLLSNNPYTVKVTYAYDLNDGVGAQEIVKTLDLTTLAKAMPVVEVENIKEMQTSLSAEYIFKDFDNIGTITSIKIYQGDMLLAENREQKIEFNNLESDEYYKVVIEYSYDLNDGNGVQNTAFEKLLKTSWYGEFELSADGSYYSLVALSDDSRTTIIIPREYNSLPVAAIGDRAFSGKRQIQSIVIPDSIKIIGTRAFYGCTALKEITIPSSVISIGTQIFYQSNVETVYYYSMYAEENNLFLNDIKNIIFCGEYIPNYMLYNCVSVESVTICDSVISIGEYAFQNCAALISWGTKPVIKTIESRAFYKYNGTSMLLPESITTIGVFAFTDCSYLTSITIPNSVISIGQGAFQGCGSLTTVIIGNKVTTIGIDAFNGCKSLIRVNIPDSVTRIGSWAFNYCTSLQEIRLSKKLTSIETKTFRGCSSLIRINIPDGVTTIGDNAFYGCSALTTLEIPDSVTLIDNYAFSACNSLTIYCEATSKPSAWKNISCPVVWDCINNEVADDGYIYTVIDGLRYGIKDDVAMVANQARNITTANIPANITYKGIVYSVTTIGDNVFFNCSSLTSVVFSDSVISIGDFAFQNCTSLTSVVIPDSVISIGNSAFRNCNSLTSIVIPNRVTTIGDYAFYSCSTLKHIYYKGTAEEWSNISIKSYNYTLNNATRYYYSESQPTEAGNYWHYDTDGVTPIIWDYTA